MGLAFPEIKQKGWSALIKELGYAGAIKFMLLYEPGKGDYTQDRKHILSEITIEKVSEDIPKSKP
jgi:tagatose-1,6-bisphosphate aldolase